MGINVALRSEQQGLIEDAGILEWRELPDFEDNRYPLLRLVDPNGDTMFSSYQMVAVVPELERLAIEKPSPSIDRVLAVARRCASSVHTYLWFIGD